jgi:hypothetical protein
LFQTPAAASAGASFTPVLGRALSTVATTAVSAASECECDDMTEAIMQSTLALSGEEEMQRQQQIEEEWVVHEAIGVLFGRVQQQATCLLGGCGGTLLHICQQASCQNSHLQCHNTTICRG